MMLQAIRKHVSPATVLALVALVFAVTGGAYAATGGSGGSASKARAASGAAVATTAKKKKKATSARGPAGPKGATGATGPEGKQGPAGATGPEGKQGSTGAEGKNGVSVTSTEKSTGTIGKCKEGGSEFTSASGTTYACNGAKGPSGFGETLPEGKTLSGQWIVSGTAASKGGRFRTSVSYALPLSSAPTVHFVKAGATTLPTGCTGSASAPGAEPGNLCVFAVEEANILSEFEAEGTHFYFPTTCRWDEPEPGSCNFSSPAGEGEGSLTGFGVWADSAAEGGTEAFGTWAVTEAKTS